jgi:EmrB/QacA subfamily drug resistance transporter
MPLDELDNESTQTLGGGSTGQMTASAVTQPTTPTTMPMMRSPWPTFVVCAIASFITTLDLSVVNVAFSDIAKSFFSVGRGQVSWVVTAYSILFGSLLVVAGQTADRIGRKRVFMIGVAMFLCGSAFCGGAPNLLLLVLGRVIQGAGGALLLPSSTGLLLGAFGAEKRTQVISWVGGISALGVASGPTVGAFMVDRLGWRSAFWINIPICLIALVLGQRVLQESERQKGPMPDLAGASMLVFAIGSLVLAISEGRSWGWTSLRVLGLGVGSAALLIRVIVRATSHASPALPVELFREKTFSIANLGSLLFGAGFSAMALNNVLFLRSIWRYSVVRAGWFSVVSPLVVAMVATFAGREVKRAGFKRLMFVGPLFFMLSQLGFALLLHVGPTPWTRWVPLAVLQGVAIGMTFPVLGAAAVARLPMTRLAVGSAVNNTFRQVGAAVGVALVVAIETSADGITGFRRGWLFSATCALIVGLLAFLMPNHASA